MTCTQEAEETVSTETRPLLAGGVTAGHPPAKALGTRLSAATGGADEALLGQQV